MLAWSHGTVGVADVCAPSFRGRSERDVKYLDHWLARGYAIVATDYEGLGTRGPHPYLHCRSEAQGNIDAVRAAQSLGLPLSRRWLVTGQSQGGQGALCTGAMADTRAPELDFLGIGNHHHEPGRGPVGPLRTLRTPIRERRDAHQMRNTDCSGREANALVGPFCDRRLGRPGRVSTRCGALRSGEPRHGPRLGGAPRSDPLRREGVKLALLDLSDPTNQCRDHGGGA